VEARARGRRESRRGPDLARCPQPGEPCRAASFQAAAKMTSIAHYNVLDPIGAGGIGEVLRARDTKVGRTVALKIVGPPVAGDPAALARLVEDATLATRL